MRATGSAPVTVRRLSAPHDFRSELAADVAAGMAAVPKTIPSRYFYDAVGSALFEEITRLPEYYLTRAETEILSERADEIMRLVAPDEMVELGSGSSTKTRLLIEAMRPVGGRRYVPIDISEAALSQAAAALCTDYLWLEIEGLVGDFHTDLPLLRRRGRRLIVFLGSTIGNYPPATRGEFLAEIARALDDGDALLLGVDLVKDVPTMLAAYDDAAGVTARFTKNVLAVVNRELDADFPVEDFTHVPRWNPDLSCMEAWLRAERDMTVTISALDLVVDLAAGEEIHTEVSCKFTREGIAAELAAAGLQVCSWFTDRAERFGLLVARPV